MAGVGDRLYFGLGEQRRMLVSYDVIDDRWQILASASSTESRHPLDGQANLRIFAMAADPQRQRHESPPWTGCPACGLQD